MPRTFAEKFTEAKALMSDRLNNESNVHGGNDYIGNKRANIYFIKKDFAVNCVSEEIKSLVARFGLTQSEIKEHYPEIAYGVLTSLQKNPNFIREKEFNGYEKSGIVDVKTKKYLSNGKCYSQCPNGTLTVDEENKMYFRDFDLFKFIDNHIQQKNLLSLINNYEQLLEVNRENQHEILNNLISLQSIKKSLRRRITGGIYYVAVRKEKRRKERSRVRLRL